MVRPMRSPPQSPQPSRTPPRLELRRTRAAAALRTPATAALRIIIPTPQMSSRSTSPTAVSPTFMSPLPLTPLRTPATPLRTPAAPQVDTPLPLEELLGAELAFAESPQRPPHTPRQQFRVVFLQTPPRAPARQAHPHVHHTPQYVHTPSTPLSDLFAAPTPIRTGSPLSTMSLTELGWVDSPPALRRAGTMPAAPVGVAPQPAPPATPRPAPQTLRATPPPAPQQAHLVRHEQDEQDAHQEPRGVNRQLEFGAQLTQPLWFTDEPSGVSG